jgi:hypothetical protein
MGRSLANIHKRINQERRVREIINSPVFKEEMKNQEKVARTKAYAEFIFITGDWLEKEHGYGKKRMRRFLEFAKKRLLYNLYENPNYYIEMAWFFNEKFKIDVFGMFGFEEESKMAKEERWGKTWEQE